MQSAATPTKETLQPTAALSATLLTSPTTTTTATPTPEPTSTSTPTASPTSTNTPMPTYVVLSGTVNQKRVSCFYGPSRAYLYKYGLRQGNHLEIIGYLEDTGYIEVRAIGGSNPCWMNLEWMDVEGDIGNVKPVDPLDIMLPQSPYYGPLTWVKATRTGNEVMITWEEMGMSPGDDSEQEPYLVEVWVCRNERLTFIPTGVYYTKVVVMDEPGCNEQSFGRVYGVEKYGYTKPREIP